MRVEISRDALRAYERTLRILQTGRTLLSPQSIKELEDTIDAIETSIALKCLEQYRSYKNEQ